MTHRAPLLARAIRSPAVPPVFRLPRRRARPVPRPLVLVLLALAATAAPLRAQATDGVGPRTITGVVAKPAVDSTAGLVPVRDVWAVLHRVGRDRAGPLDSVRTDGRGRFRIPYTVAPADTGAAFFVSAEYGGVSYFTPPAPPASMPDVADTLVVFDTTSTGTRLITEGRHLVVGSPDSTGRIVVIEVFEVANPGARTLVGGGAGPTWSVPLPPAAEDVRLGQADISPQAFVAEGGRAMVLAPFAPGLKQISFSYTLPPDAFPLSVPLQDSTSVLEVLVENPNATVSGARLAQTDPAAVDERQFRRYLAQDVPAGQVVTVALPAAGLDRRGIYVAAILLAVGSVMLLSLARAFQNRRARPAGPRVPVAETPEGLARRIVELDARFQRRRTPDAEARAAYETERAALKAELTEALARRDEG